jgi:hypothetical protein
MKMTNRELMQEALEALEELNKLSIGENAICLPAEIDGAMDALRAAIEQEHEPVECMCGICKLGKREWQGLTEVEIVGMTCECVDDGTFNMDCAIDFARAIEARLKENNT